MTHLRGTIIGIDPGEHIGICVLNMWHSKDVAVWPKISGYRLQLCELFTAEGFEQGVNEVQRILKSFSTSYVTVEHFTFTRNSMYGGSQYATEFIGAVKTIKHLYAPDAKLFDDQKPADAKLISNKVLENLAIKVKGDKTDDHAHMAAKHAITMAVRIRNGEVI